MSILSVVQEASSKIGITRPTQLIADTGATSLEIQATLMEVAGQIRDRYDWQAYSTIATITGDGAALDFAFPSNYARMSLDAQLWPSAQPNRPLRHVMSLNEWLGLQVMDFSAVWGMWTIYEGRIHISVGGPTAPIALADTIKFIYSTNLQFASAGGTPQATIAADSDVFRLTPETSVGERLLKKGLIAKWKQDKGRPYAQDMADFEDDRAVLIGADKGAKSPLIIGRQRYPAGATVALPWPVS